MRLIVIDASGYIYRGFHAQPPFERSDGTPIGAIKGYCEMLWGLAQYTQRSHMCVVFDGGRSGRDDLDPNYKANRAPRPPELTRQLAMLPEATAAFGIPSVRIAGMEADDVMASLARDAVAIGGEAVIYTSDKDLFPVIADGVRVYDPLKRQDVTADVCFKRFGVWPHQIADFLAIVGDSSDNVKGVAGIGAKGAAKLLAAHETLDAILHLIETAPHRLTCTDAVKMNLSAGIVDARNSMALVRLQPVDHGCDFDALRYDGPETERLCAYLRENELNVLAHEVQQKIAA